MSHSLMTPDWKYRGFTVGRDWDRDTWEWSIGGFMHIPSGEVISVSSDWFAVEEEDELWDATVSDVHKMIDSLIEDLTQPHIAKPPMHQTLKTYFLYKGPNPGFCRTKEEIVEKLQPIIDSLDSTAITIVNITIEVHKIWHYYYSPNNDKQLENHGIDTTENNSCTCAYETTIYGRVDDNTISVVFPYEHDRDAFIRIYVYSSQYENIADTVAKAFNLYGAKEAVLNELETERKKKENAQESRFR